MRVQSFLACAALAASASAQSISLFGRTYLVQRFDYTQQVTFADPNPAHPGQIVGLNEVEGATWADGNHMLVSSSEMADVNTYENVVMEVALVTDPLGGVTGLTYVRTVLWNDARPVPSGQGDLLDLNPRGITLNPSGTGVGSIGQLVLGDRSALRARELDLASGALLGPDFAVNPPNDDIEDLCWVPDVSGIGGRFYTVDQRTTMRVEVFSASGAPQFGFNVGVSAGPPAVGEPKGIAYVPAIAPAPPIAQGTQGIVLVGLDDTGPALQAFRRDGTLLGYESLVNPALNPGAGGVLQIESLCFDPVNGRLVLWQQGASGVDNFVYVLSPDCNGNGVADVVDIASGSTADVNLDGQPDECQSYVGGPFCFGDGLDPSVTTPCPCANVGAAGRGCANSVNSSGALLDVLGSTFTDSAVLSGSGMPASVTCIYLQGDATTDEPFGDGVRCTGGTLLRLRARQNSGGASTFPDSTDTITLSARGGVVPGSGATRVYQTYYRNSAAAFCPPETFNVTNGFTLTW